MEDIEGEAPIEPQEFHHTADTSDDLKLRRYVVLDAEKRQELVAMVDSGKVNIKQAGKLFGVSYSTAKLVCKQERQKMLAPVTGDQDQNVTSSTTNAEGNKYLMAAEEAIRLAERQSVSFT